MYQAVLNVPELSLVLRLKQLGIDNINLRCCFNGESKGLLEAVPRNDFTSNRLPLIEQNGQSENPEKLGQPEQSQKIDLRYTLDTLTQDEVMGLVGSNPKVIAGLKYVQSKDQHNIFYIGDMPYGLELDSIGKMSFLCLKCGKMLMRNQSMLAHGYNHIGVRQYPCNLCDKEYVYRAGLDRHKRKQHNPSAGSAQRYTCSVCQKEYTNKINLDRHWHTKHKDRRSPLPIKATVSPTSPKPAPSTLISPTIEVAQTPTNDKMTCKVCSKTLSSKKSLTVHFNNLHSSIHNFLCQYCFKGFYYKKDYDNHMKREFKSQRRQKVEKENIPPIEEFMRYIMDI